MKYVLMKLTLWTKAKAEFLGQPFPLKGIGNSVGFLLVFDTLEDLRAEDPDAPYVTVEQDPTQNKTTNKKERKPNEKENRNRRSGI